MMTGQIMQNSLDCFTDIEAHMDTENSMIRPRFGRSTYTIITVS